jgi:hypothetical protein
MQPVVDPRLTSPPKGLTACAIGLCYRVASEQNGPKGQNGDFAGVMRSAESHFRHSGSGDPIRVSSPKLAKSQITSGHQSGHKLLIS